MQKQIAFTVAMIASVQAGIQEDGLWTGAANEWFDNASLIGVRNGVPYSTNATQNRRITAPVAVDGPPEAIPGGWENADNVKNIKMFIPDEPTWDAMFPKRNIIYEYRHFLKAAAKYPAFCNESNIPGNQIRHTCGRELATFFAHLTQETGYNDENLTNPATWQQTLYHINEMRCVDAST